MRIQSQSQSSSSGIDFYDSDSPSGAELEFWSFSRSELEVSAAESDSSLVLHDASPRKIFAMDERTALFGEAVIRLAQKIPPSPVTSPLIEQLVAAGTSVGANYCEANDSISTKDFRHRISICRKEAKEARFWLRMVVTSTRSIRDEAKALWLEAHELNLIFSAIWRRTTPSGEPEK